VHLVVGFAAAREEIQVDAFGPAAALGLIFGFMWGIGCSLAILYSIYLGGYRKGIEESLAAQKSKRYRRALQKIEAKRDKAAQP
jgi:hypothetical protein